MSQNLAPAKVLIVDDQPIVPSCYPGSGPEDEDWLVSGKALHVKKDVFGNPIGEPESPFASGMIKKPGPPGNGGPTSGQTVISTPTGPTPFITSKTATPNKDGFISTA